MDKERLEKLKALGDDPLVEEELLRLKRRKEPPPRWIPEPSKKYIYTAFALPFAELELRILSLMKERPFPPLRVSRRPKIRRGPVSGKEWKKETVSWLRNRDRRQWGRK